MSLFGHLFGNDGIRDTSGLLPAIERAVIGVEPLLKQIGGYPERYRESVAAAMEYAHELASRVPGPVLIDRESYASDALVHALFPSLDYLEDALQTSLALRDYRRESFATDELYALMGMRRCEKSVAGMELSGQMILRDVVQKVVYFISHTIENPASGEQQSRELVAMSLFDNLVGKVKMRVEDRKRSKQAQLQEKDALMARLRAADASTRPILEAELAKQLSGIQSTIDSLELGHYLEDFEAVLLNPERYLRLDQTPITLDSMGVRQNGDAAHQAEALIFTDLIGFDRRNWTVTMVRCKNLQSASFAERLEQEYRKLAI